MNDQSMTQADPNFVVSICETDFRSGNFVKPVSETLDLPEPEFEEIQDLFSDKPVRFNKLVTGRGKRDE